MAIAEVPLGVSAPYSLSVTVTRGAAGEFDLALVTSGAFRVQRSAAPRVTMWACTISAQSSDSVTLTHEFEPGDCTVADTLIVTPELVTSAGTLFARRVLLRVRPISQF